MPFIGAGSRIKLLPAYLLCLILPGLLLVREANPVWWSSLSVRGLVSTAELLLCAVIWPIIRKTPVPVSGRIILLTSLWLCWCLLSTLLSDTMWQGLPHWSELVIHAFFLLSLYRYLNVFSQARNILLVAQISVLAIVVLTLSLTWLSTGSPRQYNWVDDAPFFNNIRHLGFIAVMIIPLGYYFLEQNQSRYLHLSVILLTVGWTLIFWLGGRGAFFSLALATLIYLYWYKNRIYTVLLIIIAAALLSQLFIVNSPSMNLLRLIPLSSEEQSLNDISSGRLDIYLKAITYWWNHAPIFGLGADHFRFIIPDILRPHIIQPHSFPVQLLISYGIPGTLLLAGLFCIFFIKSLKNTSSASRLLILPVFSGALHSLTDGVFYHAYSTFLTITLIALCSSNWNLIPTKTITLLAEKFLTLLLILPASIILAVLLLQINFSSRTDLSISTIEWITRYPLYLNPGTWINNCSTNKNNQCLELLTDKTVEQTDNPCYYYSLSTKADPDRMDYYCHAQ